MLSDYSGFSLDELERVIWALSEHSLDKEAAAAAIDKALGYYVEYLSDYLHSVESSDELEDKERRLRNLFRDYGFLDNSTDSRIQRDFEWRHEQLDEKKYRDDEGYFRSGSGHSESQISDREIGSMFGQLRQ